MGRPTISYQSDQEIKSSFHEQRKSSVKKLSTLGDGNNEGLARKDSREC